MLNREEALQILADHRRDSIVVTTMGVVRPWGKISRSDLDFASADSAMGHAADVALGIAIAQPRRKVICLNGDGSMLMALGTLATAVDAQAKNFVLFVFENGTYEITGNQPIPGARFVDFASLARGAGFRSVHHFEEASLYAEALPRILSSEGPIFVVLKVVAGHEGPLSRGEGEDAPYLKPSLAQSAHALRRLLFGSDREGADARWSSPQ